MELDLGMSTSGGDGDLPTRPTSKDEIMVVEKLLDFKHDMKKIDKVKLKHLKKKKQELKERLVGFHLQYGRSDSKICQSSK